MHTDQADKLMKKESVDPSSAKTPYTYQAQNSADSGNSGVPDRDPGLPSSNVWPFPKNSGLKKSDPGLRADPKIIPPTGSIFDQATKTYKNLIENGKVYRNLNNNPSSPATPSNVPLDLKNQFPVPTSRRTSRLQLPTAKTSPRNAW